MITRTTSLMRMQMAAQNLQAAGQRYAELQNQAITKKRLNQPSDDPAGTANLMKVRNEQANTEQYWRNVSDAMGWLTTLDSSLSAVNDKLSRVRDLTLQGANDGSMSPTAKEAIAVELEQIRASLLDESNATYLGRSVYAGTSDAGAAFNADYTFNGVPGSSVERRIGEGKTVRVDQDGAAVFGTGANSVFATIDQIVTDLRAGVNVTGHITKLDTALNTVRTAQSSVGARHGAAMDADDELGVRKVDLEAQRSSLQDVQLETIIMELTMQETVYQTALSVVARSSKMSLMDFIR